MNISRRSFLKLAALSTAAVAVSASMTGCSNTSILNPNVSVVLQEKANAEGKYTFTGEKTNLLADKTIWKDGSKVASSENVSLAKLADKIKAMTNADAKKLVEDTLKKDYNMTGKKVSIDTAESFPFKATDASHYVLTITFTVA